METYVTPWPVYVFLGIAVLIIIWWFISVSSFFSYMAKNHPQEYKTIGSPTLLANNTPNNNISFLRYILGDKYITLDDPTLTKKGTFIKKLFYTYLSGFILLVIGVFAVGNS